MERPAGPACSTGHLAFQFADPDHRLAGVRLQQAVGIAGHLLDFTYDPVDRAWHLRVPRPPVWRMEYLLQLCHPDGGVETITDPDNPRRVGGAFGDKSVLTCPEYAEPEWLRWDGPAESWREFALAAPALHADVWTRIWSPGTPTDRVLLVHDGAEYDKLASLPQYSAAMVAAGEVQPHHLVLLSPGDRNEWYSANPAYARALTTEVLLRVRAELGTDRPVVGLGTSLGALAMLHAQRRYPKAFAGLFLQSGSFFQPRHDRHESTFPRYLRIVRFVGRVIRADSAGSGGSAGSAESPVPAVLTCGLAEENRHNNRIMALALRRQGYPVDLFENPDAHNFTGWRDALHPHLTDLLRTVWGTPSTPVDSGEAP
jgi:enterochelin esterase family protein